MDLDEPRLLAAMRDYVDAGRALADAADVADPRTVVDLAEAKAVAGMRLQQQIRRATTSRAVDLDLDVPRPDARPLL